MQNQLPIFIYIARISCYDNAFHSNEMHGLSIKNISNTSDWVSKGAF